MDEDKQIDKIQVVDIGEEMKQSYIAYSMSVIVSRALPDVRDGLKPVHRRILHAMNDLHLDATKPYRKSATIVGETMGKYHPHGDSSIYDAMVRLAQPFSTRYMLVDGHGNFGSVDGDDPAAMRYTEARLSRISMEMLADIEKNTVDFVPNYDENEKEPSVLPARIPNLLINGSSGIAVGMATNIPPHNLSEVIDAVVKMIDNHIIEERDTDIEEIIDIVKGPDFPTGAMICGTSGIKAAYRTGRGKISVRAVSNIEPIPGASGRDMIVVTEIPYQVNKAKLIEKIAELVKDKRVEGISDLRDESNRTGMRVVIELKKDVHPDVILNQLYKYTQLQDSFGVNMLALVDGEPKVLNIKQVLTHYLNHQKQVVTRRTQFELDKAAKRAHILEGLIIAIDNIDEVISIVRSSKDRPEARSRLMERFKLSEEQAQAIVNMTIGSLTGLEREKVELEYKELKELIEELKGILADEKRLYGVIREEIMIVKAKYGDERRTKITFDATDINIEDLIKEEMNVITMTHLNYVKRLPVYTYKSQNRGGKGIIGMQTREEDLVRDLFLSSTHDYILFFTTKGRVYRIKAYEIPEFGRQSRGVAIVNLLELSPGEDITAVIPVRDYEEGSYLFMVTEHGVVKKTPMMEYANIRKSGLNAINLREGDTLISVKLTHGDNTILLATKMGYGIHFHENCVRPMGRTATGVRGIKLRSGDVVRGTEITNVGKNVLIVTEYGFGKCTDPQQLTLQNRGGMGLKIHKVTDKTGNIVGIRMVDENEDIMLVTSDGIVIRTKVRQISVMGRITQGVKLMNLSQDVRVVGMANLLEEEAEEELEENAEVIEESDIKEINEPEEE